MNKTMTTEQKAYQQLTEYFQQEHEVTKEKAYYHNVSQPTDSKYMPHWAFYKTLNELIREGKIEKEPIYEVVDYKYKWKKQEKKDDTTHSNKETIEEQPKQTITTQKQDDKGENKMKKERQLGGLILSNKKMAKEGIGNHRVTHEEKEHTQEYDEFLQKYEKLTE